MTGVNMCITLDNLSIATPDAIQFLPNILWQTLANQADLLEQADQAVQLDH